MCFTLKANTQRHTLLHWLPTGSFHVAALGMLADVSRTLFRHKYCLCKGDETSCKWKEPIGEPACWTLSQSFLVPQSLTRSLLVPRFLYIHFILLCFFLIFFFFLNTLKMAGGRPGGTTGNTQVPPTPHPPPHPLYIHLTPTPKTL